MYRKTAISKLNNTNYRVWSSKMTLLFKQLKLWAVVEGTETQPNTLNPNYPAWEEKDLAAKLEIMSNLEDQQADTIRNCSTANAMWIDLKNEFEPTTDGNQVMTLNSLVILKMHEEDEMNAFINSWKRKLDDCLMSGVEIESKLQRLLLLGALPPSWSTFVTTQNFNTNTTLIDLINCIRQEEAMKKARRPEQTQHTSAMIAYRGKQSYQNQRTEYRPRNYLDNSRPQVGGIRFSQIFCTICNKSGHTNNQCRFRQMKNKQSYQRPRSRVEAHLAEEISENESYPTETNSEENDDGYDDLLQVFLAEDSTPEINTKQQPDNTWYFDTGATHHMTNNKQSIRNYNSLPVPIPVVFGNNGSLNALGKGDVSFLLQDNQILTVDNVYFVPGITKNLLSVSQATKNGTSIKFEETYAQIKHKSPNGQKIKYICRRLDKGLYRIPCPPTHVDIEALYASTKENHDLSILWHHRLAHINLQAIKTLQSKNMVIGLPKEQFTTSLDLCEGCLLGKMPHHSFPLRQSRSRFPLQLVHSDLCGPFPTPSITGSHYFISFIDDYSRFTVITFLKTKNQALQALKNYLTLAENITKSKIQFLQTDGGGEYNSNALMDFCKSKGIHHRKSTPQTPQQYGIVEKKS